ncbi:uncharacterized protein LOC144648015, partial [Oculina patagonica]
MMVSDEEKRWLVVGIAMNKVAAPVLRDFVGQQMDTHYANNTYCHGLTALCTLKTLTYHHVNADPNLKRLKFQNINNNLHNHGNRKNLYNYNINSSVDLAKLFLPDYLAEFSAFDESLDISAILRLLGYINPAPIFLSPNPLISIQASADDVRENVRNKWGHCNVTDWTDVLFNDCFSKLETLVRSLGLTGGMEKSTLDQLSDWKTKGCQLCMGHAVDQNLLSLVQQDVNELIKKAEAEQTVIQEALAQQKTEQTEMQNTVTSIQDQQSSTRVQLEDLDKKLEAVLDWKEQQMKENKKILEKLVSVEKTLSEELLIRVQGVEDDLSGVKDDISGVKAHISRTDERVKQLENDVRDKRSKDDIPNASLLNAFDVKGCKRKLVEHYKKTAKVPTTVWSSVFQVDLDQIYTRLSWVKEEQTLAGSSKKELSHYTELLTEKTKNGAVPKRILVQGETGIGKTTFVKKLLVDWSNLEGAKMEEAEKREGAKKKFSDDECEDDGDVMEDIEESNADNEDMGEDCEVGVKMDKERKDALSKFELVVSINLKEVSKCQTLREVVSCSRLFPEDEEKSIDDLLSYIRNNQEKILVVFDGYDEYRTGSEAEEKYGSRSDSPIYKIFQGNILRDCTVLVTTRSSRADEIQGPADIQAEITGFNMSDREEFMRKMLGTQTQVDGLLNFLWNSNMEDLARVPLLTLFFCLLWKEEKEKLMKLTESKSKLFRAIIKHVLQHSHRKHFPSKASKLKEADYEEILVEIGKVALEGLLKGDLMFEFGQLPEKVRGEQSIIVGLFQLSEYGPSLEPMEMVSFIHKSIQEYLAAWYITHRCVPEGSLGKIEQHARTLEDCEALENVFQFICGSSDDGAVKVFQHLTSVRISDPTLDLSKAIPDVENETDVPLCDVTDRHERFSSLVYNFFQEVHSKAELISHCFDCIDGIILVTRPLSDFIPTLNELSRLVRSCAFVFSWFLVDGYIEDSVLYKSLKFLNCLHIPLTTDGSEVLEIGDFLRRFQNVSECVRCKFKFFLCFRNCRFQLYITDLDLYCDVHARLFTETTAISVPSLPTDFCSEKSCLKFLTSLQTFCISDQTGQALGAVIRNCKHLKRIQVHENFKLFQSLGASTKPSKQVPEPLSRLLPRFDNIITLFLDLSDSAAVMTDAASEARDTSCPCIIRAALTTLVLSGIKLTPAAAAALGRSLPEMSSLLELELTGEDGSVLQAEDIEALFGRFSKALPLRQLTFSDFS